MKLTVLEAAKRASVHKTTILEWITKGILPAEREELKTFRYKIEEKNLIQLIASKYAKRHKRIHSGKME